MFCLQKKWHHPFWCHCSAHDLAELHTVNKVLSAWANRSSNMNYKGVYLVACSQLTEFSSSLLLLYILPVLWPCSCQKVQTLFASSLSGLTNAAWKLLISECFYFFLLQNFHVYLTKNVPISFSDFGILRWLQRRCKLQQGFRFLLMFLFSVSRNRVSLVLSSCLRSVWAGHNSDLNPAV